MPSQFIYNITILTYNEISKATIEENFLNRIDQDEYKITLDVDLPVDAGVKSKVKLQYWIYPHSVVSDKTQWEEVELKKSKNPMV
jgi:hypothetical protein